MTRLYLIAAFAVSFLIASPSWAAAGWHPGNETCTGTADSAPAISSGTIGSWCPSTTATLTTIVHTTSSAYCNWDGDPDSSSAGSVTLSVTACSGSSATVCDTPMVDSSDAAWTVTSDSSDGRFSVDPGIYLITASGTTATGRLLCVGR